MNSKVFYELDPHNRLIISKTGKESNLKRFRKVVNGRFKIDKKNGLYYEVFKSSKSEVPQKIKFSGDYSLDRKGNLVFTMNKWNNQCAGNRLGLKTGIIDANDNRLIFMVDSKVSKGKKKGYILKLYGRWYADKNNRIGFKVKREPGAFDELIFFDSWRLNDNNEIEYDVKKDKSVIRLKGSWKVTDKHRISYVLNREIKSGFDFMVSLGNVRSGKNKLHAKFEVEIKTSKKRKIRREIIFSGGYKMSKKRNISLEISPGKKKSLVLKLEKKILTREGAIFLESFIDGKERYIGGGIILRW